jgi:FMN reductase
VVIAATGGTARHSLALDHALRPLFSYLHAVVAPTAVFAASADWGTASGDGDALRERIERAAGELADLAAQRSTSSPGDDGFTPFEALLNGADLRPKRIRSSVT